MQNCRGHEISMRLDTLIPLVAVIVIFGSIIFFVFIAGHVPSVTDYPHSRVAEPSPYDGPCIEQQALNEYNMTCSVLHAILQPG